MLKVVVDTSVFIAGYRARSTTSYSARIIASWRAGEFKLVMSAEILEEIIAKFIEKDIPIDIVLELISNIGQLALHTPGNYTVYRLNDIDPDDNMLLAAAQESGADYLVSLGAKHVLPLKHHKGTQIVSPELFLRVLEKERN